MDMGIYGYMDILQLSSNVRQMSVKHLNIRRNFVKYVIFRRFFVEVSSKFLKIRQIFVKCHPNVVNLGPWAKNWKTNGYYTHKYTYTYTYTYVYLYTYTLYLTWARARAPGPGPGPPGPCM